MAHRIDIRYPVDELQRNQRRFEQTYRFEFFDRVPVLLGIEPRYLLHARGISFKEYFSDAKTQLLHQLENIKWRIENISDDWFAKQELVIAPDFQNVTNASGCGCEIFWQEDETPHALPCIATLDEMNTYKPPPWEKTLWGKRAEWFLVMRELAEHDFDVRLNGERIPVRVTMAINGDSPFMSAVEMAGVAFYSWLLEDPGACHEFLRKITDRYIEVESRYREILGKPMNSGLNYSDDSAQVISLKQYREFCVPIGRRMYDAFGCDRFDGRLMHLCGRNVHLHPALLNDLHITMLHGFGSANKPEEMSLLAGKVVLQGNLDPMTLYQGSPDEIETETMHLLELLAPAGGLILGDGFNVVPGTSLRSLEVVKRASKQYGVPRQSMDPIPVHGG